MKAYDLRGFLRTVLWLAPVILAVRASGGAGVKQGPLAGKPAPAFQVQGIYGEDCSLEAFKGHILVMQFGTSW
jgi:hypothetical protein